MSDIATFNVNIYAIEVEKSPDLFLGEGKFCIEFNFDNFRAMRTSATDDFKWPKEYLHTKYTTEYPQHLSLKNLTVSLVKPSVFGFSDQYKLNPVDFDLKTIATGIMRYKAILGDGFAVSFILEMTQISDASIEIRNLRYAVTDPAAFSAEDKYIAVVVYEPGSSGTHVKELNAFVEANLGGEDNEAYRDRKKDEIKALQDKPVQKVKSRTPVEIKDGVLTWDTMKRIVMDDVSFIDLYYSSLYIGIKKVVKDQPEKEAPYIRCTRIPIDRCLIHNDITGKRDEGSFPGDEDKIIHLRGALEASIYLNDIPYFTQVYAPNHYVLVSFENPEVTSLMEENRADGSGVHAEFVETEINGNALTYTSTFVKYGIPCELETPSLSDDKGEQNSGGEGGSETDILLANNGNNTNYSTTGSANGTLTAKLL